MVTTEDIAAVAFGYLASAGFKGKNILYIKSQKEYTMKEVTELLGNAVGIQKLKYIEFPQTVQKKGMVASGQLSANAADMLIEINQGISNGILKVDTSHKIKTTPTTLEIFAKTTFGAAFKKTANPSITKKLQGLFLKIFLNLAGKSMLQKEKDF